MVFPCLPFPMTIYDNIAFGVKLHDGCPSRRWTNVSSGHSPGQLFGAGEGPAEFCSAMGLSGGQQQPLCICAHHRDAPDVIPLDEPANKIDPINAP